MAAVLTNGQTKKISAFRAYANAPQSARFCYVATELLSLTLQAHNNEDTRNKN